MKFPKGEVKHQNLSTAYTNLVALLSTLKSEGFSGTLDVEFPGSRGVLFVVSGELVNAEAIRTSDQKRLTGQEAARSLLALSSQKDGVLNVYRWPPERVSMMADSIQHEIVFKGLSTDFTRLDRLILSLREDKHEGFLEILTKDQKTLGVLFFRGGEPVDLYMTTESGPSVIEKKSIPLFLENAVKQGTLLNVYRSQSKSPMRETEEPEGNGGLDEITQIFQEVLSMAENMLDRGSQRGTFLKAFKESLIKKSSEYPFLDPFGGEFEYRDGAIVFTGDAGARDFTRGIGECLRQTLNHLEEENPKKKMLRLKLKARVESSLEHHREVIKKLGVDSVLESVFR
jgi:hypothetical protein